MIEPLASLQERIANQQAIVGIYGLGYVGLPLALRFAEVGLKVIGFDTDPKKVALLNAGQSYIERLTPELIQAARSHGFEATDDFTRTREVDAIIISVPTPLNAQREYGVNTRFIELAGEINHHMPHWVVGKIADALNDRGKPIKGSRILVLGLAYKKNIDDTRESPAVEIMDLLQAKGAHIAYSDPHVPVFPHKRDYHFDLQTVPLTADTLGSYDCVVLATDHDGFDYALLQSHAALIVDTRARFKAGGNIIAA